MAYPIPEACRRVLPGAPTVIPSHSEEIGTPGDQEAAEAVGKMNTAEMDGRTLKVSIALAKEPRGGSGASRGNGGGRDGYRR